MKKCIAKFEKENRLDLHRSLWKVYYFKTKSRFRLVGEMVSDKWDSVPLRISLALSQPFSTTAFFIFHPCLKSSFLKTPIRFFTHDKAAFVSENNVSPFCKQLRLNLLRQILNIRVYHLFTKWRYVIFAYMGKTIYFISRKLNE